MELELRGPGGEVGGPRGDLSCARGEAPHLGHGGLHLRVRVVDAGTDRVEACEDGVDRGLGESLGGELGRDV